MILIVQKRQLETTEGSAARSGRCRTSGMGRSLLFSASFLVLLSGCKYDGSFMQMNSDSGSPFFGLQLAVKQNAHDVPVFAAHQGDSENRPSLLQRSRGQFDVVQLTPDPSSVTLPRKTTRRESPRDVTLASHPVSEMRVNDSERLTSLDVSGAQSAGEITDLKSGGPLPERRPVTAAEVHRQLNDF